MLKRESVTPPKTSRVPDEFFEKQTRESLIRVTLPLGKSVAGAWPFEEETGVFDNDELDELLVKPKDTRERLAALITSPANKRFPKLPSTTFGVDSWVLDLLSHFMIGREHSKSPRALRVVSTRVSRK